MIVIRPFSLLQLLVKNFTIDSITAKPLQTTYAPGVDYMADYDEWLFIQVSIYMYIYVDGSRKTWTTQVATCVGRPRRGFSTDVYLVGRYSDPRINTIFKHYLCALLYIKVSKRQSKGVQPCVVLLRPW